MSFSPVFGPESPSQAYFKSKFSASLASLTATCSSLHAKIFSMVDNLAMRIPSSWHRYCLICWLRRLRKSPPESENALESNSKKTAVVFYPSAGLCTLERTEDIDGKSTVQFSWIATDSSSQHSRESQLPRDPSQLSAIHQSPA